MTDLPSNGSTTNASVATYALRGPLAAAGPYVLAAHELHAHDGRLRLLPRDALGPGPTCCSGRPAPQSTLCFTCHDGSGAQRRHQGPVHEPVRPGERPRDLRVVLAPGDLAAGDDPLPTRSRTSSAACSTATPRAPTATSRTTRTRTTPVDSVGGWTAVGRHRRARPASPSPTARPARRPPTRSRRPPTVRVRALLQVPLGLHPAARPGRGPPQPLGARQGRRAQPGQRLVPPGRGRGQEPDRRRWHSSLAGTSPYKLWTFETDDDRPLRELPRRRAAASPGHAAGGGRAASTTTPRPTAGS